MRPVLTLSVSITPAGDLMVSAAVHSTEPTEILAAAGALAAKAWEAGCGVVAQLPKLPPEAQGGKLLRRPPAAGGEPEARA